MHTVSATSVDPRRFEPAEMALEQTCDLVCWLLVALGLTADSERDRLRDVLHELAHLIEPSHGPRFQAILTEHMPDWRAVEIALNGRVMTRG